MQRVLFHSTVFGPIRSRRLGLSLGINLSPNDGKVCTFDCLYCEAGFNAQGPGTTGFPTRAEVARQLEDKLLEMAAEGVRPDVITFSGNGEPTLHPDFAGVIDDTIALRDRLCPEAKVSVLSNSTRLFSPTVKAALLKVDNNILKLDSAVERTMRTIDRPNQPGFTVERVVEELAEFRGQCIIQTLLLRGEYDGAAFDNTTPDEIDALIEAYRTIGPRQVMLYSIDRKTPAENLEKIDRDTLLAIGERVRREAGVDVEVV